MSNVSVGRSQFYLRVSGEATRSPRRRERSIFQLRLERCGENPPCHGFFECLRAKIARLEAGQRYFYASRLAESDGNWRNGTAIWGRSMHDVSQKAESRASLLGDAERISYPFATTALLFHTGWCVQSSTYIPLHFEVIPCVDVEHGWPCEVSASRPNELAPRASLHAAFRSSSADDEFEKFFKTTEF